MGYRTKILMILVPAWVLTSAETNSQRLCCEGDGINIVQLETMTFILLICSGLVFLHLSKFEPVLQRWDLCNSTHTVDP